MGDFKVVKTRSGMGDPEMIPWVAGGTFEEGDSLILSSGEVIKSTDDAATVFAIAKSAGADGEVANIVLLTPDVVVEGVDISGTAAVAGDTVGINLTDDVLTFENDGTNQHGVVIKVVDATAKIIQVVFPVALTGVTLAGLAPA